MLSTTRSVHKTRLAETVYKEELEDIIAIFERFGAVTVRARQFDYANSQEFFAKIGNRPLNELRIKLASPIGGVEVHFHSGLASLDARVQCLEQFFCYNDLNDYLRTHRPVYKVALFQLCRAALIYTCLFFISIYIKPYLPSVFQIPFLLTALIVVIMCVLNPLLIKTRVLPNKSYQTLWERYGNAVISAIITFFVGFAASRLLPK